MAKSELRSAYIPHERVTLDFDGDAGISMTRQEFQDECDVNILMAKYEKQGLPFGPNSMREPMYYDFTIMPTDLQSAMNIMMDAEEAFMSLPAKARLEFGNDPVQFVEFASKSSSLDKMREWGLAPPAPAPKEPLEVRVVPDPKPAPKEPASS